MIVVSSLEIIPFSSLYFSEYSAVMDPNLTLEFLLDVHAFVVAKAVVLLSCIFTWSGVWHLASPPAAPRTCHTSRSPPRALHLFVPSILWCRMEAGGDKELWQPWFCPRDHTQSFQLT